MLHPCSPRRRGNLHYARRKIEINGFMELRLHLFRLRRHIFLRSRQVVLFWTLQSPTVRQLARQLPGPLAHLWPWGCNAGPLLHLVSAEPFSEFPSVFLAKDIKDARFELGHFFHLLFIRSLVTDASDMRSKLVWNSWYGRILVYCIWTSFIKMPWKMMHLDAASPINNDQDHAGRGSLFWSVWKYMGVTLGTKF